MRLLVCGSRRWTDSCSIAYQLALLFGTERERVVIHGNAGNLGAKPPRGADVIAGWCAGGVGADVIACPALWECFGKRAGKIRNAEMLREHEPDRGLAFGSLWWLGIIAGHELWRLTGTGDMVSRMLRAGLPVRWICAPGAEAIDLVEMPTPTEQERRKTMVAGAAGGAGA